MRNTIDMFMDQLLQLISTFTVETDHKPLISIIHKNLNDMSPRIQHMMMKLQKYDLNLVYTPGKYITVADALRAVTSWKKWKDM